MDTKGGARLDNLLGLVFLLHFSVDFLLLLGSGRIAGQDIQLLRCGLGALVGALLGTACLIPSFSFLRNLIWHLLRLALSALLAYGADKTALRQSCIFAVFHLALLGAAVSADQETMVGLALFALLLWTLCRWGFGEQVRSYRTLTLRLGNQSATVLALQDTGNQLRDPISGEPVVVISAATACRLTGLTETDLHQPMQTLAKHPIPGLRLIPYHTVGKSGMLLGLRFRDAKLDGKKRNLLVAFAPEGLGNGEVYQALTGGAL